MEDGSCTGMTEWYYTKMGLKQGPVPEDELRTKIRRAEIGGTTLVWKEGMADWLPLSKVPELMPEDSLLAHDVGSVEPQVSTVPKPLVSRNVPLPQPPAYDGNYVAPKIPNYMWQAVLATVISLPLCCIFGMPLGVVAIVFAAKVEGLRVQGNYAAATAASNAAKGWTIASFCVSGLGFMAIIGNLLVNG